MFRWKFAAVTTGLLGAFSLVGGLIGFIKAGSLISALVGLVTSAILLPCAWALYKERQGAIYFAGAVALLLGARFLIAYTATPKVMPHLIVMALSSLVILSLGALFFKTGRAA